MSEKIGSGTDSVASDYIAEEAKRIEERAKEVERKISGTRELGMTALNIIAWIAIAMSIFHLATGAIGQFTALRQRALHLMFALIIAFIRYSSNRNRRGKVETRVPWYDYLFILAATVSCLYMTFNADVILERAGIVTTWDMVFSILIIICVLEATRRTVGYILMGIGVFMLLYCKYGFLVRGIFWHPGFDWTMIIRHMMLSDQGLWSTPIGVSASYIALFLLLGAALHATGLAEVLLKIAKGIFGTMVGGPAKMAVIASSMFATISGSSTSNVATTGIVTIPLMKKTGLKPELAGAVEAAASMGGQITPPVMGAVAFIMAEFLGISYLEVAVAAALPAFLYYVGVFSMIHYESHKIGALGLKRSEIEPGWKRDVLTRGYLIAPVILLVVLLVIGRTPMAASFWSFWAAVALSFLSKRTRLNLKSFLRILSEASITLTVVAIPSALAGFVVGAASMTGLTVALSSFVTNVAQNKLLLTLLLTMVMSLIMGMGVPTVANYILMTIMTVPVMLTAGVLPLAAHLFCFHFGIMSELTPPVAITSYTASAIAGGKFWPTAFNSVRLAAVAYIVPYFFVFNPGLLLGQQPFAVEVIWNTVVAIVGSVAFGSAMAGFMRRRLFIPERLMLAIGACLVIWPGLLTDTIGFVVIALVFVSQLLIKPKYGVHTRPALV